MIDLQPFQQRFLKGAFADGVTRAALSLPRGNGKSHLGAFILKRALTPGDPWHVPGAEYLLLSGSLEQARQVFNPLIALLDDTYRIQTSTTRLGVHHKPSGTTLRVVSSKAKTAFGLGANNPICLADEPGAWDTIAGTMMNDALDTAVGKPGAAMKIIYIGTLSPEQPGGWWHQLIERGSGPQTYVQVLRGDPEKWSKASEIHRCNPLMWKHAASRRVLLQERDDALGDSRLQARFQSFRMNAPAGDSSTMLLTTQDWLGTLARPVAPRDGAPVVGVDMGQSRAWSSAVAWYRTGRIEAVAISPGVPDLATLERMDRAPRGTYQRLHDQGVLLVADGLRVPPASMLMDAIAERWGQPLFCVADRFREAEIRDAAPHVQLDTRITRWSDASFDIRALRRSALDGPLSVDAESADLLTASLSIAMVVNDTSGNTRLRKRDPSNNTSRDDVAAALVLAAGAVDRHKPWDASETPAYSGMTEI